ncbi:MAG: hypothetical protein ACYC9Z_18630 [Casimicrobiaceae bacterium]
MNDPIDRAIATWARRLANRVMAMIGVVVFIALIGPVVDTLSRIIVPTANALAECRYDVARHGSLDDQALFAACIEVKGYIQNVHRQAAALPVQYDPGAWTSRFFARLSGAWKQ